MGDLRTAAEPVTEQLTELGDTSDAAASTVDDGSLPVAAAPAPPLSGGDLGGPSDDALKALDARRAPSGAAVTGKPTNGFYQLYSEVWKDAQDATEILKADHDSGFKDIGRDLTDAGVAFGALSPDDYDTDINDDTLRKSETLSKRFLPYAADALGPLVKGD